MERPSASALGVKGQTWTIVSHSFVLSLHCTCMVTVAWQGIQLRLYRHDDQSVIDPAMPFVEDFYRVGDTLGKGGFGKVMKALHLEEQQYYAIKYIPESKTSSTSPSLNDAARARHMESFRKEIDILKRIQHPHIVQFKEVIRYRGQGLGTSAHFDVLSTTASRCLQSRTCHGVDARRRLASVPA